MAASISVGRLGEGALKGMLVGSGGCLRSFLFGESIEAAVAHGGGFRGRLVCGGLGGFPLPVPVCNRERAKDLARLDGCLPQVSESMCGGV